MIAKELALWVIALSCLWIPFETPRAHHHANCSSVCPRHFQWCVREPGHAGAHGCPYGHGWY